MRIGLAMLLCVGCSAEVDGASDMRAGDGGAVDAAIDGSGPFGFGCSGDLRSILDANGNVVETCPLDQGCSAGTCIPACQAAANSHGSIGCDFWVSTPVTYDVGSGQKQPCFAMFVANTWPTPAQLTVSRAATTHDPTLFGHIPDATQPPAAWPAMPATGVPINEVAVLYLSGDPTATFVEDPTRNLACPSPTAIGMATDQIGTGVSSAFHVTSSVPVAAYDIFPFGGAESFFPAAELLYPSSAWGKNYVVLASPKGTATSQRLKFVDIIAVEDATEVTLAPTADLLGGGPLTATAATVPTSFSLLAGQYAHFETPASANDLAGSILLANKPVSVIAGEEFFRLQTADAPGGEGTHHQILPVSALASEYVVAPYVTRRADLAEEAIWYRLVGTVDGTTLSYDPAVPGAPSSIGTAAVVDFQATGAFRVSSQGVDHGFSIAQVMSSGNVQPAFRTDCATIQYMSLPKTCGDEDFVPLVAPAQFLTKYVFFTDPTYSTTTLEIVRRKTASGYKDVTVDCLGVVGGWQPVGTSGEYEFARPDLVRAKIGNGTCKDGRHAANSAGPFGLVVYGLDTYSSYGYPAGGNAATLNGTVVTPTL